MALKVGMRCTVVYGKTLYVPSNILSSVFCHLLHVKKLKRPMDEMNVENLKIRNLMHIL